MKTSYSIAFLALVLLVVSGFFLWLKNTGEHKPTLRRVINCRSSIIDDSVLSLDADTTLFSALVTFDKMPLSQEIRDKLLLLNVALEEGSQIFEIDSNIIAYIPTVSLCELSKIKGISSIFVPPTNNTSTNATQ